jgi:hypothetical protein
MSERYWDWIDLGQRAMACKHWRWLPGMLAHQPGLSWQWRCYSVAKWSDAIGMHNDIPMDAVPDLRDPATVGCLLALVRQAYPNNDLCVDYLHTYQTESGGVEYAVYEVHDQRYIPQLSRTNGGHPTEAHALVAALEAANGA